MAPRSPLKLQAICAALLLSGCGFLGTPVTGMRQAVHAPQEDTPRTVTSTTSARGADSELATGTPTPPFIIDDAVVHGPSSAEVQAAFDEDDEVTAAWSGGPPSRSLLHGRRRPAKYTKCSRCTIVTCTGQKCTGHCKRNRQVFDCSALKPSRKGGCNAVTQTDVPSIPISALTPPRSLIVTAPLPYIGCVHTANQASGCPAPGTPGILASGVQFEVANSTCSSHRYLPNCTSDPMYPVGVCWCDLTFSDGRYPGSEPCDIAELQLDTPPRGSGEVDDVRIVVEDRGSATYTSLADYTDTAAEAQHVFTVAVPVAGAAAPVNVKLEVFTDDGRQYDGDIVGQNSFLGAVGFVSDDYYDAPPQLGRSPPDVLGDRFPRAASSIAHCVVDYNYDYAVRYYDYGCIENNSVDYFYRPPCYPTCFEDYYEKY